jgi:pyruvate formate lyase activating enzyme
VKKAVYYKKLRKDIIQCTLCPWNCIIKKGDVGHCGTRINYEGVLHSLVYGEPTGFQADPIEKKPLFHFHPGMKVLSFGTQGCNFNCKYCCNYFFSQTKPPKTTNMRVTPQEIVNKALTMNCEGIAYTYNEPSIFFEYAFDTARIAHNKGLLNVFVTNGCINKAPLKDINHYLDAAVIDFKGFNDDFYKKYVGAKLDWVKKGVKYYSDLRAHKEITNLVVPGLNDDPKEIRQLARFIIDTLGDETPLHLLKFFPLYEMEDVPQTPVNVLEQCYSIARDEGLKYVYLGNIDTDKENTYCPDCGELLINRSTMRTISSRLKNGCCPKCNEKINIKGIINHSCFG